MLRSSRLPLSELSDVLESMSGWSPFHRLYTENSLDFLTAVGHHGRDFDGLTHPVSTLQEARSMTRQLTSLSLAILATLTLALFGTTAPRAQETPRYAGPTDQGFLLPNGWRLKPAGEHISLADLPLNIIPLADNRHVLAATSGYNAHELAIVDLQEKKVVDKQTVRQSWFGLAVTPEADRIWWSGGGGNMLHAFGLADHRLTEPGRPEPAKSKGRSAGASHFRSGLALDPQRKMLYSLDIEAGTSRPSISATRKRSNPQRPASAL